MKNFFSLLLTALLVWSCTKDAAEDQKPGSSSAAGPKNKMEALQELASSLPDMFGEPITRTGTKSIVDIALLSDVMEGIDRQSISIASLSNSLSTISFTDLKSRLSAEAVKAIEEDIHVVNYGLDEGFAILSTDPRVPVILAYAEQGNLTDETMPNPGLQIVLDLLPGYIEAQMSMPVDSIVDDYVVHRPVPRPDLATTTNKVQLITTKWSQYAPFNNRLASAAGCIPLPSPNGKYLAGCVAVAMGQLMAYHGYPYSVGGVTQPWTEYRNAVYGSSLSTSAQASVATLMYDIGQKVSMSYGCSASGSLGSRALNAFINQYGYTAGSFGEYTLSQVQTDIAAGRPLYVDARAKAQDGTTTGHAWVFDGTATQLNYSEIWIDTYDWMGNLKSSVYNGISQTYPSSPMLRCNWGWEGHADGYYVAGIFNPPNRDGSYIYNFYDLYIISNLQKGKPTNRMTLSGGISGYTVNATYPVASTVSVTCEGIDSTFTVYGILYPGQSSASIQNYNYSMFISNISPSSDATYNYAY